MEQKNLPRLHFWEASLAGTGALKTTFIFFVKLTLTLTILADQVTQAAG